jgi:predicted nucleic acid-binding protein
LTSYLESSAVLALLLGETGRTPVDAALRAAERVVASDLTLVECERSLRNAVALGRVSEHAAGRQRTRLRELAETWFVLGLSAEVLARAAQTFPAEPVRTLDALHLASALVAQTGFGDVALISLDQRVRVNAEALGFAVLP